MVFYIVYILRDIEQLRESMVQERMAKKIFRSGAECMKIHMMYCNIVCFFIIITTRLNSNTWYKNAVMYFTETKERSRSINVNNKLSLNSLPTQQDCSKYSIKSHLEICPKSKLPPVHTKMENTKATFTASC